jgi:acyl-CoA synthetase (AMP-forming)/AMP-acid ligase II
VPTSANSRASDSFTTLVQVLRLRAREAPEKTACTFLPDHGGEQRLSYAELDRRARAVAAVLADSGVTGERVFLLYPPGLDYVVTFLGCLYAGVIAIPAYPPDPSRIERTLPRLVAIADDATPRLTLTTAMIRTLASGLFQRAPELARLPWLATDTIDEAAADRYQEPSWGRDPLAFLQYTSGSTGDPKGVVLSHANLMSNLAVIERNFGMHREDRVLSWLPPYHDMGLIGTILEPLYVGGEAILMAPMSFLRRPQRWLEAISHYRATVTGSPSFGYDLCVRKTPAEVRARLDLTSLEVAFVGAEPIRARTMEAFADAFAPCGFRASTYLPCYGLAESTLLVSGAGGQRSAVRGGGYRTIAVDQRDYEHGRVRVVTDPSTPHLRLVGSGHPAPELDVQIVDVESEQPLAPGLVGEVWVAGDSVARGYFGESAEPSECFGVRQRPALDSYAPVSRPYLRTGDLGFFAADGELFICGRRKDLIIANGLNLHPQDIEAVVEACHPQLRPGCCAAFSVDHGDHERVVVVNEVTTEDRAELRGDEIVRAIHKAVAAAHGLRVDEVVLLPRSTILKTSSGKIQRRACRAALLAGTLPRIAIEHGFAVAVPS